MPGATKSPTAVKRRTPTKRHKAGPLNEQDWIKAATRILVKENVRGIRIDALCKSLGVTKGSFYWHFSSRSQLLTAMLRTWRRRMTLNIIHSVTRTGGSTHHRLRELISLPRRAGAPPHAQIEMSIRDWARRGGEAQEAVREVDHIRVDFLKSLFLEDDHDPREAELRAYIIYCIIMGDSMLHASSTFDNEGRFVDRVVEMLGIPSDTSSPERKLGE